MQLTFLPLTLLLHQCTVSMRPKGPLWTLFFPLTACHTTLEKGHEKKRWKCDSLSGPQNLQLSSTLIPHFTNLSWVVSFCWTASQEIKDHLWSFLPNQITLRLFWNGCFCLMAFHVEFFVKLPLEWRSPVTKCYLDSSGRRLEEVWAIIHWIVLFIFLGQHLCPFWMIEATLACRNLPRLNTKLSPNLW